MPQSDPTLAAVPDTQLVARIKAEQDSLALTTLIERHSGIYFKVVNSYAATYPSVIKRAEMDDDKMFNLYNFVLAYNPDKGTKLSTYIGDRTDFLCRGMLRRDHTDPLSHGYCAASGCAPVEMATDEEVYSVTNGSQAPLIDESASARVTEAANSDVAIEDIRRAAAEVCTDKRFMDILTLRHFTAPKCQLSWRDIGARLNLSHERARCIYNENIERIKTRLLGQSFDCSDNVTKGKCIIG